MTSTPTWCLENRGSFASIHVILPPHSQIHCESDAVVTFSEGVEVQGVLSGGIFASFFRVFLGGESFFTTLVENTQHEGICNVMLAAADPGGIELHKLTTNQDLLLTSGAYAASDTTVTITTELQSRLQNSLLSGTGFFLLRASGNGTVACAAYGSIHKYQLKVGETRAVDNGHLVAWSANMNYRVGLANARQGILASMKSGEGLMCHFVGPGTIYLQSHKCRREMKTTKGGNDTIQSQSTVLCMFVTMFFIIAIVIVGLVLGSGNMNIQMNANQYDNAYRSKYSTNGRQQGPHRTLGEF